MAASGLQGRPLVLPQGGIGMSMQHLFYTTLQVPGRFLLCWLLLTVLLTGVLGMSSRLFHKPSFPQPARCQRINQPFSCFNGTTTAQGATLPQNVLRSAKRYNQQGVTSATKSQHGRACAEPLATSMQQVLHVHRADHAGAAERDCRQHLQVGAGRSFNSNGRSPGMVSWNQNARSYKAFEQRWCGRP